MMILLLLLVVLMSGCFNKGEESQDTENTNGKQDNLEEKDPIQTDDNTFPLTGEQTHEAVDHRIVGVMVNNHPAARPQSGLDRKSTRLNSSHVAISYAVFCLK